MASDTDSFKKELYNLLKVRGYHPIPLDSSNQRVNAPQEADVIQFMFTKDGKEYGKVWLAISNAQEMTIYYDNEQQDSPSSVTPGVDYDDTWTGLLKYLKQWSQRRQLGFELANRDRLGDDMKQREYYKKKEKLGEGLTDTIKGEIRRVKLKTHPLLQTRGDYAHEKAADEFSKGNTRNGTRYANFSQKEANKRMVGVPLNKNVDPVQEGYHSMGKKASYNDGVPNVKIVLQHSRNIEEGEQRFRNIARIFVENTAGERFLIPTRRPGLAKVYARHVAEGGTPYDDRGRHITSLVEEYNKMAGFVRATRNNQYNESTQRLVLEGVAHYNNLRETLSRMTGHRGYSNYFESWTPALMEAEADESNINELFVQETVDPRIESAMPILSRLHKQVNEMNEVQELAEWADSIIETVDESEEKKKADWFTAEYDSKQYKVLASGLDDAAHRAKVHWGLPDNVQIKVQKGIPRTHHRADHHVPHEVDSEQLSDHPIKRAAQLAKSKKKKLKSIFKIAEEQVEEDLDANQQRAGQLGPTEKVGPQGAVGKLVGNESRDPEMARIRKLSGL
jgi:hypothetical protein